MRIILEWLGKFILPALEDSSEGSNVPILHLLLLKVPFFDGTEARLDQRSEVLEESITLIPLHDGDSLPPIAQEFEELDLLEVWFKPVDSNLGDLTAIGVGDFTLELDNTSLSMRTRFLGERDHII